MYAYTQAIDDNMIRRMRFACWTAEATHTHTHTHTHSEYVIQLSHSNNGYANAPQCYVTHALPVLFTLLWTRSYRGSDTFSTVQSMQQVTSVDRPA